MGNCAYDPLGLLLLALFKLAMHASEDEVEATENVVRYQVRRRRECRIQCPSKSETSRNEATSKGRARARRRLTNAEAAARLGRAQTPQSRISLGGAIF